MSIGCAPVKRLQKNDKVQKLEDECDWYRKEALRLDSFNTAMKKDLKYMKGKLEILGESGACHCVVCTHHTRRTVDHTNNYQWFRNYHLKLMESVLYLCVVVRIYLSTIQICRLSFITPLSTIGTVGNVRLLIGNTRTSVNARERDATRLTPRFCQLKTCSVRARATYQ